MATSLPRIGHADTGVCPRTNPALGTCVEQFRLFDDDGHCVSSIPSDSGGHGTQTAAIIHSVVPEARLYCAAVIDGGHIYTRILAGLEWLQDQPIQVLSMAIGLPVRSPVFERNLRRLAAKDVLIVVPTGNRGTGVVFTPAWSSHVLTVGAVDGEGRPEVYSSSINTKDGECLKPEILAPARLEKEKGTSIASSYIAGMAARLRQQHPHLTAVEIRQRLIASCRPVAAEHQYKVKYGVIGPRQIFTANA